MNILNGNGSREQRMDQKIQTNTLMLSKRDSYTAKTLGIERGDGILVQEQNVVRPLDS